MNTPRARTLWNVTVTVVDLIRADTEQEAIALFKASLSRDGHEPLEGNEYCSAIISEDIDD